MDVAGAVAVPLLGEVLAVFIVARVRADDDATFVDALLVDLRAVFGDACANERTDDATRCPARTGSGERSGQRSGHGEPEARNDCVRTDRGDRAEDAPDGATDGRSGPGALHRLAALFDRDLI